jgi:glycosyltransferase involved in cell wall biosynthesis
MDILYVSKVCSQKKFENIYEICKIKPQQQAQKFHYLLASGFAEYENVKLTLLSDLPISHINTKRMLWKGSLEIENKMTFKYLPHLNVPLIGNVVAFFIAFFATAKWFIEKGRRDNYIICDVLNLTISVAAKAAAKFFAVKAVAIVTDIPIYMQEYNRGKKGLIKSLIIGLYTIHCSYILRKYDAYIVLTKQMNELINPNGKPSVVAEGLVHFNMVRKPNSLNDKYREKVIIYAGGLYEKYGVKKLIEAFVKVPANDVRLWLFGSGELEEEIRKYKKMDDRIEFFGVLPNQALIEEEIKATLLVNPRPSSEEFTKYSFPSKIMEYMVSGTPVLTTKLPGMPEEYYDYVYLLEDESVDGMAKIIERILKVPKEELHAKGAAAKEFVLREKNNIRQASRIIEMIKESMKKTSA